ncbi:MAG: ABC transporter permease [Terrimicrobiaceae bacterium]|nr:ABC transporter permease [Terrimicrobiaceae bacterium]
MPAWRAIFELRRPIPRRIRLLSAWLGFGAFLLVWSIASHYFALKGDGILFPSPARVIGAAADYAGYGPRTEQRIAAARESAALAGATLHQSEAEIRAAARADLGTLWLDVKSSFLRVTVAFLLAAALGIPAGILMGSFRIFESLLQPLTEFIRYVPVPALVPVLMLFFGIGETSKVMLIFAGTFFQLALMVAGEIRRVPIDLLQVCATLGGTRLEAIRRVLLPAALPGIFDTLRICNGWAWTWVIVAEIVAADSGLGFRIVKYQRFLQTDKIFLYLIVLGLIGLLLDYFFRQVNRTFFHWTDTTKR